MAYTERRDRYYRGRYKNPPGVTPKWGTVSETRDTGEPFTRRIDAERAAEAKEALVREQIAEWNTLVAGRTPPPADGITYDEWLRLLAGLRRAANGGRDPYAGEMLLRDWVTNKWLPAQDLAPRTLSRYQSYLKCHILPAFGDRPLNTLDHREEIDGWERSLLPQLAPPSADNVRKLLSTILNDAKDAELINRNPAERRRGRGRIKTRVRRGRSRVSVKEWVTPLEALLVAERCALLAGRDDELLMWVTCVWCGLRWGEVNGLTYRSFREGKLFIEQQLSADKGRLFVDSPKDESYRNDQPGFFGALDLPPFLAALWAQRVKQPAVECLCAGRCGAKDPLVFLGSGRGHHRQDGYGKSIWHPAADGVYPAKPGRGGWTERPVLVDLDAEWPGVPVRPALPYASGPDWAPPRRHGQFRWGIPRIACQAVPCPECRAPENAPCSSAQGAATGYRHRARRDLAARLGHVRHPVPGTWLPVRKGLTPHGLRHSLKVWMDEDRIPAILMHDRMGHAMPGIGGTYSHPSPAMRTELTAALQERWERALHKRFELHPRSPVPLLDALLAARRGSLSEDHLPNVSQSAAAAGRNRQREAS